MPGPGVERVVALHAFDPTGLEWPFDDKPLPLTEGLLIEVEAHDGDWSLGHAVDRPDQRGYYPSNYAVPESEYQALSAEREEDPSFVYEDTVAGTSPPDDQVVALYDFDPAGMEWSFEDYPLLPLDAGQVIQLMVLEGDMAEQWGLGYVVGEPGRRGYFPKNYTGTREEYDAFLAEQELDSARGPEPGYSADADAEMAAPAGNLFLVALYDFDPTDMEWPFADQQPLPLTAGQHLQIVPMDGGAPDQWEFGHAVGKPDLLGLFPLNYTEPLIGPPDDAFDGGLASMTAPVQDGGVEDDLVEVVALYDFDPSTLEWSFESWRPLPLIEGEGIVLQPAAEDVPEGWTLGHLKRDPFSIGLFPEAYVGTKDAYNAMLAADGSDRLGSPHGSLGPEVLTPLRTPMTADAGGKRGPLLPPVDAADADLADTGSKQAEAPRLGAEVEREAAPPISPGAGTASGEATVPAGDAMPDDAFPGAEPASAEEAPSPTAAGAGFCHPASEPAAVPPSGTVPEQQSGAEKPVVAKDETPSPMVDGAGDIDPASETAAAQASFESAEGSSTAGPALKQQDSPALAASGAGTVGAIWGSPAEGEPAAEEATPVALAEGPVSGVVAEGAPRMAEQASAESGAPSPSAAVAGTIAEQRGPVETKDETPSPIATGVGAIEVASEPLGAQSPGEADQEGMRSPIAAGVGAIESPGEPLGARTSGESVEASTTEPVLAEEETPSPIAARVGAIDFTSEPLGARTTGESVETGTTEPALAKSETPSPTAAVVGVIASVGEPFEARPPCQSAEEVSPTVDPGLAEAEVRSYAAAGFGGTLTEVSHPADEPIREKEEAEPPTEADIGLVEPSLIPEDRPPPAAMDTGHDLAREPPAVVAEASADVVTVSHHASPIDEKQLCSDAREPASSPMATGVSSPAAGVGMGDFVPAELLSPMTTDFDAVLSPMAARQAGNLKSPSAKDMDRPAAKADTTAAEAVASAPVVEFIADNRWLQSPSKGVLHRLTKRQEDVCVQAGTTWGSVVRGTDTGDGWLKLDDGKFIPFKVNSVPILVPKAEAEQLSEEQQLAYSGRRSSHSAGSARSSVSFHQEPKPSSLSAGASVTALYSFDPASVDWPFEGEFELLPLVAGDEVELLPSTHGVPVDWAFGRLLRGTRAEGYFPRVYVDLGPEGRHSVHAGDRVGTRWALFDFNPWTIDWPFDDEAPLVFSAGDEIQLLPALDGVPDEWAFGHHVGDPSSAGYFPRDFVGTQAELTEALKVDAEARATLMTPDSLDSVGSTAVALYDFDPSSVEWPSEEEQLLALSAGDDVCVLRASPRLRGQWLYGYHAATPGEIGFFPKACVGSRRHCEAIRSARDSVEALSSRRTAEQASASGAGPAADLLPLAEFTADNRLLRAPCKGILHRSSKRPDDICRAAGTAWGDTVKGIDVGDGFIQLANGLFLPLRINDVPVLRPLADPQDTASHVYKVKQLWDQVSDSGSSKAPSSKQDVRAEPPAEAAPAPGPAPGDVVVALYDFNPKESDWPFADHPPLKLASGDLVHVVGDADANDSEWASGYRVQRPGLKGYFPKSYVRARIPWASPAVPPGLGAQALKGFGTRWAEFKLDNTLLQASSKGLLHRRSKREDDVCDNMGTAWGSVVMGADLGDGWLMLTSGLFLPFALDGVKVLEQVSLSPLQELGGKQAQAASEALAAMEEAAASSEAFAAAEAERAAEAARVEAEERDKARQAQEERLRQEEELERARVAEAERARAEQEELEEARLADLEIVKAGQERERARVGAEKQRVQNEHDAERDNLSEEERLRKAQEFERWKLAEAQRRQQEQSVETAMEARLREERELEQARLAEEERLRKEEELRLMRLAEEERAKSEEELARAALAEEERLREIDCMLEEDALSLAAAESWEVDYAEKLVETTERKVGDARRARKARNALSARHGLPADEETLARISITLKGAKGLSSFDTPFGEGPYCICRVPARPSTEAVTEPAADHANPVWDHAYEISDYAVGDPLDIIIRDSVEHRIIGRVLLQGGQFYPDGLEADVDLRGTTRGKAGKVSLKVDVPDAGAAGEPCRGTAGGRLGAGRGLSKASLGSDVDPLLSPKRLPGETREESEQRRVQELLRASMREAEKKRRALQLQKDQEEAQERASQLMSLMVEVERTGAPVVKAKLTAGSTLRDLGAFVVRKAALALRPALFYNGLELDPSLTLLGLGIPNGAKLFAKPATAVLTSSKDGTAKVWDVKTGACELSLEGHADAVNAVALAPDCKAIVTASDDRTAKVWSTDVGECTLTLKGHGEAVYCALFSSDSSKIVTTSQDGTAKIWGAQGGRCERTFRHGCPVLSATISKDNKSITTIGQDGSSKIWSTRTGVCERTLLGHGQNQYMAAFSSDGETFVTPGAENLAKIYNVDSGKCVLDLAGHSDLVLSASFAPLTC